MSEITLGTPVTFNEGDVLYRHKVYSEGVNRSWRRLRERDPDGTHTWGVDREAGYKQLDGFIVGKRTCSDGKFENGYYDEAFTYTPKGTYEVYLIATGLRDRHVKVRVEDVQARELES